MWGKVTLIQSCVTHLVQLRLPDFSVREGHYAFLLILIIYFIKFVVNYNTMPYKSRTQCVNEKQTILIRYNSKVGRAEIKRGHCSFVVVIIAANLV